MHAVDGSRIDLNLLVVLDAVLQTGSVTRAATELGLTQPTISHALSRLRAALGDPLLVRAGRTMVKTPRAERLAPAVRSVLAEIDRVLTRGSGFDPATSDRAFSIACPDLLAAVLPAILGRLAREAPRTRIEARPVPSELEGRLADRAIDLAIVSARDRGAGLEQSVLGRVAWCIVARRGHEAVASGRLSRREWLEHPHVIVQTADGAGIIGRELARLGIERRVGFVAPSSLAALHAVAATDWFFAAPRELITSSLASLHLVAVAPPIPLAPVRVALVWHGSMREDEGHRFLRELLGGAIRGVLSRVS
jgi:DNA-binding transcriptional LysR family regulator